MQQLNCSPSRTNFALFLIILLMSIAKVHSVEVQLQATNVECVRQLSPCSCETASGGRIDLSPLAKSDGTFAFNDLTSPSGNFLYYYNPCNGATCDGSSDAAVCQRTNDKLQQYLMGTQSSAKFNTDPTLGLQLIYSGLSGDRQVRETHLQLICDTSGSGVNQLTPLDDGDTSGPTVLYKMTLRSGHCCETGGGGGGGGMSGGDILLIIFFSLIIVYLAAGLVINLAVRKQSFGLQALPNVEFWASLPGLVRDGVLFVYSSAKGAVDRRRGKYESV